MGNLANSADYVAILGAGVFAVSVVVFIGYRGHVSRWLETVRAPDAKQYRRLYARWLIGIALADLPALFGVVYFLFTSDLLPMLVLSAMSFVPIYLYKPFSRAQAET